MNFLSFPAGLDPLLLIAIIVTGIAVLLVVVICCCCCCILLTQRRQHPLPGPSRYPGASKYYHPDPRVLYNMPISQRTARDQVYGIRGPYRYDDECSEYSDDASSFDSTSTDSFSDRHARDSFRERENRLRHLAQVITQSPYLNVRFALNYLSWSLYLWRDVEIFCDDQSYSYNQI